ncbi:EndoU domain-containing protein [Pseudomonas sp. PDM13]|uniref:EndoU domain-containing protein n=1 Tax=Pseudomonas sp. PDM13 TaxID=2769255 RepID=UPI0021E0923E|nr:EndoU domain-containing protein [Pseudomonas sp. PDM13]MCU9946059.1 EndoU domain-containing protein [Pseudomonas sp. PDM13]
MECFKKTLPLGLLAACCSLPALAQINCAPGAPGVNPLPVQIGGGLVNSRINPQISQRHIFCGEINGAGAAVGYHSRPAGHDPRLGALPASPVAARITAGQQYFVEPPAVGAAGPYRYLGGGIEVDNAGVWVAKGGAGVSSFYPDSCTQVQVIASVRYAYTHPLQSVGGGNFFSGPSAPSVGAAGYCVGEAGNPFTIGGFLNNIGGLWTINTAYPIGNF